MIGAFLFHKNKYLIKIDVVLFAFPRHLTILVKIFRVQNLKHTYILFYHSKVLKLVNSILFTLLLFLLATPGYSQNNDYQNFVITQFGLEEGLPQSSVNDIIQTKDGYIWLATYGGLVRFDGNKFTTFDRFNTEGMSSDRIIKIYEGTEGDIWIFSENTVPTVLRFKDGKCEKYRFSNVSGGIIELYTDENDKLWATAFGTIFRFENEAFIEVQIEKDQEAVTKALKDTKGIWLVNDNKLLRTTGDLAVQMEDLINVKEASYLKVVEFPKKSGQLFIGTIGNGILRIKEDEKTFFDDTNGLPLNQFLGYVPNKDNLYAVLFSKIAIWNGSYFENFNPFKEDPDFNFKSILEDNEGNIWIGSSGNGLFKLRPSVISMIDKNDGLENEIMLSLTQMKNGTSLLSTNCGGIYEWRGGKAVYSAIQKYFNSGCNWSVFQDSKGRIWVGAGSLYVTDSLDKKGRLFNSKEGYDGVFTYAITEDVNGNILVGAAGGLYIYDGENFQHYSTSDGLYDSNVTAIFEDESGVIWLGTKSGLNVLENGEILKIELLNQGKETQQPSVRSIHKDIDGSMWFGTYGNGLFKLKDHVVTNITTKDGLFDNIVSHIVEDEFGNFWMGSNRGISRVKRSELNDFIEGTFQKVNYKSYGNVDGMNSAETNGGFQPSTFTDSLGKIYFPTVEGVAVVSTRDVENNEVVPPVYIEQLRNYNETLSLDDEVILNYDQSFLEINYTAISFTNPKKTQFKYRLVGFDNSWIEVGNRRSAIYSKIPPGEYTFQVSASNSDGIWNEEVASFNVSVIPPFWQTKWFLSILVLCFLSIGPMVYYFRIRKLKMENERQRRFSEQLIESQENERRRIASELHDGLGQQILVIKNRVELAKLNITDDLGMIDQLNEIQHSADRSIEDVRNISHDLRPVLLEKFGLTDAVLNFCDQLEKSTSLEWSYHIDDIDGIFPKNKEINFYRILQEGANNILKHAESKQPSIIVTRTSSRVNVTIYDDGKGYEASIVSKTGTGLGLIGIKERVETLGGQITVISKKGEGTTIKIQIPIE